MTLEIAIKNIEQIFPTRKVMMIEFEDGSGYNFNFRLNNEKYNRFIDFRKENDFVQRFMQAKEIMDKW